MNRSIRQEYIDLIKDINYDMIENEGSRSPITGDKFYSDFTREHINLEIDKLEDSFGAGGIKGEDTRQALEIYISILESLFKEMDFRVKMDHIDETRANLDVENCDFIKTCPRKKGGLCLRGRYILSAASSIGPPLDARIVFIGKNRKSCFLRLNIKPRAEGSNGPKRGSEPTDLEIGSSSTPGFNSYVKEALERIKNSGEEDRFEFQKDLFTKGTLKSTKKTLSPERFWTFSNVFKSRLSRAVKDISRTHAVDVTDFSGYSNTKEKGKVNGDELISVCPVCKGFVNRSISSKCYNCGYRFD